MARVHQGWLLIADLSGYTAFLSSNALEAAHTVVSDLLETLLGSLEAPGSPLRVVKLEGDAILCRADDEEADGAAILDRIDHAYHAFRLHLLTLDRQGRCDCFACGSAQALDLKFVVHHGPYVVHRIAGREDVSGPEVIAAHRLLKNGVKRNAYALFSEPARDRCPAGTRFTDHEETYEHVGTLRLGVFDLHRSYIRAANTARLAVSPEEAHASSVIEVPAPPEVVWAWHVDPARRRAWDAGARWSVVPDADGRRGLGAEASWSGGACSLLLRIVEWRPPHSLTVDSMLAEGDEGWRPDLRVTWAFSASEAGTRVEQRVRALREAPEVSAWVDRWVEEARDPDRATRLSAGIARGGSLPAT